MDLVDTSMGLYMFRERPTNNRDDTLEARVNVNDARVRTIID